MVVLVVAEILAEVRYVEAMDISVLLFLAPTLHSHTSLF